MSLIKINFRNQKTKNIATYKNKLMLRFFVPVFW